MTKAVLELEDDAAAGGRWRRFRPQLWRFPSHVRRRSITILPAASNLALSEFSTTGPVAKIACETARPLRAGGDIHCLTEIVLSLVKYHREARTLVDPDF